MKNKKSVAVVLAGGRGTRMSSDVPKQYMNIAGHPLIYYSLKVFEDSFVDEIVLVCGETDIEFCRKEIVEANGFKKIRKIVAGGKERYHSVANGLQAIDDCDVVFIHDGARPFVTQDVLKRAYEETLLHKATVIAVPSKDTVKIADGEGYAASTPNRSDVWIIQTPQTFDFKMIKNAYCRLIDEESELSKQGVVITDDAMVMEHFGNCKVKLVNGDYRNIKITTPEDILVAGVYLANKN